jgi:choice-of-anchor A domain-containing protein
MGLFHNYLPDQTQTKRMKKTADALATLVKETSSMKFNPGALLDGVIKLNGSNEQLNVFKINGGDLVRAKKMSFEVPSKAATVVVITGQTPSLTSALMDGDVTPNNILFVFPDAATFRVQGGRFLGTVVAPKAAVYMESDFMGSIFASEISMREPMKHSFYTGCLASASDK